MTNASNLVTINCSKHHQRLTDGLWNSFLSKHGVDLDLVCSGRSIGVHRILLDIFLSSDKLQQTAAAAAVQPVEQDDCSVLESLLEFLYTGQLILARERLDSLLKLATDADFGLLVDVLQEKTRVAINRSTNAKRKKPTLEDVDLFQAKKTIKSKRSKKIRAAEDNIDKLSTLICEPDIAVFVDADIKEEQSLHESEQSRDEFLVTDKSPPSPPNEDNNSNIPVDDQFEELDPGGDSNAANFAIPKAEVFAEFDDDADESIDTFDTMAFVVQQNADIEQNSEAGADDDDDELPYKCEVCAKAFATARQLRRHNRIHTGRMPYKCNICPKAYDKADRLDAHLATHTGEKPYKCHVCYKAFSQEKALTKHVLVHTGDNPYKCSVCRKDFSGTASLEIHLRFHQDEKPYKCQVCAKEFVQACHLKTHSLIHAGEKPYPCQLCSKAFVRASDLQCHVRTHTGERPYECNICAKAFAKSNDLQRHFRIHTGEKPYKCSACPMAFGMDCDLNRHFRIHTGEKPYACSICPKVFSQAHHLKSHLLIHSDIKPYKCNVCEKAFVQAGSLKSHIRTHSAKKGQRTSAN